jgi:hypothetical protein
MENQSRVFKPEDLVEYKRIPLPHVLTQKGNRLRMVDNKDYNEGDYIKEHLDKVYDNGDLINRNKVWEITKIYAKRQAKGDWEAWGGTPYYYEVDVQFIGQKTEREL